MITKKKNYNLKSHNTFGMDVTCKLYIEYDSVADLVAIDFEDLPQPILNIGNGSNLLFTKDFPGTVLHSKIDFIYELPEDDPMYKDLESNQLLVSAGSGVIMDDLCEWSTKKCLWGAENLSHIPGEVGAAAVQNIGAYGVEFSDIAKRIYCYDIEEEEFVNFNVKECEYGYRDSIFKHTGIKGRYIVTNAIVAFSKDHAPRLEYGHIKEAVEKAGYSDITPALVREIITGIRKTKLPETSEIGSAGSFFKNPIVSKDLFDKIVSRNTDMPHYIVENGIKIPAAWLIEQCGWKGRTIGNAGVYKNQPLVLINATGKASPEEIIALKNNIISSVEDKFGISLVPEVEII